jgi:mycoredoxin
VGDRAGLPGAGPGQHADRPSQRLGDRPLVRIEGSEDVVGAHRAILPTGTVRDRQGRVGVDTSLGTFDDVTTDGGAVSEQVAQGRAADQLTIYSTPWCGYCTRLKRQLERQGIEFVDVNIEADPEAAEFVMEVNGGNQTVPTVVFSDGVAMTNPTLAEVTGKLAG